MPHRIDYLQLIASRYFEVHHRNPTHRHTIQDNIKSFKSYKPYQIE